MAIKIKCIPVLTGKVAKEFVDKSDYNYSKRKSSVDFSKQVASAAKILAKSNNI